MTHKTIWISVIAPPPKILKVTRTGPKAPRTALSISQALLRDHVRQAPGASQKSIAQALNWDITKVEFIRESIKGEFYSGLVLISEVRIG